MARRRLSSGAITPWCKRVRYARSLRAARGVRKRCSSSAWSSFPGRSSTASVRPMFRTDDGVALAYDVRGEGLPLVLVNGLPDTKDGWSNAAGALAPYFRVVTYNLRNQGLVEEGGDGYRTERHVRDLDQLLAHLRIGQFVGVGLSMGARILADFTQTQPDH